MDLTTLTLEEFLNEDVCRSAPEASPLSFSEYSSIYAPLVRDKLRDLDGEYALHQLDDVSTGDVALVWNGDLVGFYHENLLMISDAHRDRKLAVPLILEAYKSRGKPSKRTLTNAGRAALTSAWKVASGVSQNPWV